ncbi:MAG: FecR family protein [Janthinobacterium lividum]
MSDSVRITHLFNLYIQNKATEAEIVVLFDLLKDFPAPDQLDEELFALWNTVNVEKVVNEPDWNKLYQQVISSQQPKSSKSKVKSIQTSWYYAAAAAVFIGVISVWLFSVFHNSNQAENVNYITYSVPNRSTKTIILNDGSKVILNANTTIKYPQYFTEKTREVNIDGEAYFEVVHLSDKPFIVHSSKLQTQVLGTTFNVDAYSKSSTMKVTVVTGKVAVKEALSGKQFMLVNNEQVTLNATAGSFKKTAVDDAENVIVWQEGKLIFEDASLEEIARQLTLKFGVKTTLSNPKLKSCRISAVFQNKPLKEILEVITRLTNSGYTLKNNTAIIFGKGCNSKQ